MIDDAKLNKVPAVTLAFWIAKIAATTLGETGGDAVSMSMNFGYLAATGIFAVIFVVALALQVAQRRYRPSTTVRHRGDDHRWDDHLGLLDRTAGLGYPLTSLILFGVVLACLGAWRLTTGSVSVARVADRKTEIFYWTTILASKRSAPRWATTWRIPEASASRAAHSFLAD